MSETAMLAGTCAGVLTGIGAASLLFDVLGRPLDRGGSAMARALGWLDTALAPLRLAGSSGVLPTDRERMRLSLVLTGAGVATGLAAQGALLAGALAIVAGSSTSRLVASRRDRYGRRLDAAAARAAVVLAEGLEGGRSVRAAIELAPDRLDGPVRVEFDRARSDLSLGLGTDDALERLRCRARSRRLDAIVAALRLQRRSGGELARLLRDIGAVADEAARVQREARAATAQARFSALLVVAFGPCAVLLGELAAPGTASRIAASSTGVVLVAIAAAMQGAGALAVARISRVRM